jgi:hypothetical protein
MIEPVHLPWEQYNTVYSSLASLLKEHGNCSINLKNHPFLGRAYFFRDAHAHCSLPCVSTIVERRFHPLYSFLSTHSTFYQLWHKLASDEIDHTCWDRPASQYRYDSLASVVASDFNALVTSNIILSQVDQNHKFSPLKIFPKTEC